MKSRDVAERCTFHYIIVIFKLIVLSKNNSAITKWTDRTIAAICVCANESPQPDQQLGLALEGTAQAHFQAEGKTLKALSIKRQATAIGHKTLAKRWGISL